MDDEQVANFCAVTSADPDLAKQYLQVADNNLEQAISLYFESGGASIESQQQDANPPPPHPPIEEEEVRERIAPVTERLINPGEMGMAMPRTQQSGNIGIFNQRPPRSAFDDSDEEDDDDDDLQARVGSSNLTAHQSRLANLFRPPFDLIKNVDIETAKQIAHSESKWVMVNIQDNTDFLCQQLNRDLWKDKRVKDCVKQNFIFLQYANDSPAGQEYQNTYPFDKYPHISILDPRTGEQLKHWDAVPDVSAFMEELYDFLSSFSLKKGHKNPAVEIPKKPKKVEHMTEDEQIEMAMRESMGLSTTADGGESSGSKNSGSKQDPVELDDSDEDMGEWSVPSQSQAPASSGSTAPQDAEMHKVEDHPETDEDRFILIEPLDVAEPTEPTTTTRIQFRYSGGRVIRRFNLADSVRTIFAVIKHEIDAVKGHYFSLTTPDRKKLIEHLDETVESCNLKNSVVMIELED